MEKATEITLYTLIRIHIHNIYLPHDFQSSRKVVVSLVTMPKIICLQARRWRILRLSVHHQMLSIQHTTSECITILKIRPCWSQDSDNRRRFLMCLRLIDRFTQKSTSKSTRKRWGLLTTHIPKLALQGSSQKSAIKLNQVKLKQRSTSFRST